MRDDEGRNQCQELNGGEKEASDTVCRCARVHKGTLAAAAATIKTASQTRPVLDSAINTAYGL